MNSITVHLHGATWPDLEAKAREGKVHHVVNGHIEIARIPNGMQSGRSAVTLRVDLPDGSTLIADTSLALLLNTAKAFEAAEQAAAPPAGHIGHGIVKCRRCDAMKIQCRCMGPKPVIYEEGPCRACIDRRDDELFTNPVHN